MAEEFDPRSLTEEKNLLQIYRSSRAIPASRFNRWSTLVVFVGLLFQSLVSDPDVTQTVFLVREYAEVGIQVALATLGFLVAGFTIFATISQPDMLLAMAKVTNPLSGLSYLKHNLFLFVRVFVYYLTFSIGCLSVIFFCQKGGLVPSLLSYLPNAMQVRIVVAEAGLILLGTGFYYLVVQLKSFIFNIYSSVMTSLRWKATQPSGTPAP